MKKHLTVVPVTYLILICCSLLFSSYHTAGNAPSLRAIKYGNYTIYVRLDVVGTRIFTTNGPGGCPFTEEYSSVTLHFFSDDLGTVPVSVTSLPVSLHHFYNFNTSVSNSDFTIYCNGTSTLVDNDMLSFYDDGCDGNYSAENYYINNDPGYTIIY